MSVPTSPSKSSSPVSAATTTHHLPPAVHAIGGSIGSALAILVFYPLERVRVELQSRAGDGSSVIIRDTGAGGESDENSQNLPTKQSNDALCGRMDNEQGFEDQTEDVVNDDVTEHVRVCSTPDSSDRSFEIIPSLRSDVESLDTSFNDDPVETNSLSSREECDDDQITYIGLVQQSQDPPLTKSTSDPNDDLPNAQLGTNTQQTLSDESKSDRKKPPVSHETIIQCLLRLHNEQTLYKGASHMVTTLMISNAIFFYTLQVARQSLASLQQQHSHPHHKSKQPHPLLYYLPKSKLGNSLVASSLAGAINVLLTNPMWVASLRIMESKGPMEVNNQQKQQQNQKQPNIWNVMQFIARKEGISRLWNGTSTSLMLVSNPIIQHFIYEQLRLWLLERRFGSKPGRQKRHLPNAASLSPIEAFAFGALAKAIATVLTYPLQLAQVLLRLQKKKKLQSSTTSNSNESAQNDSSTKSCDNEAVYGGTIDCLYQQFSRGGIPALFQGMNAKLLQTVLTAAFTFLSYEQTLLLVSRVYEALA